MIHPSATIYPGVEFTDVETVSIDAGAVVGAPCPAPDGRLRESFGVVVGRHVRIGANAVIMGGTYQPTMLCPHVVIGASAVIGHDATIGPRTYVAPQVGVAGEVTIGADCKIGGQAGIANCLVITDSVTLAAQSGAARSLLEPGAYAGSPALPIARWRRACARFARLGKD